MAPPLFAPLAAGALLLCTSAACSCDDVRWFLGTDGHASDRQLIESFRAHRTEFETLRQMLEADRSLFSIRMRAGGVDQGIDTVPAARLETYRRLLERIGVAGGLAVSPDRKVIFLTASTRGMVTHGSEKGYVFDPRSPTDDVVLPDLDGMTKEGRGAARRELGEGWFLYFQGD